MPNITLESLYDTEITDAAATVTRYYDVSKVEDVVVDVTSDKGMTIVITPVLSSDDNTVLGKPSSTLTIPDLGATDRAIYSKIAAKRCQVLVTKTEAGTTSGFGLKVIGVQVPR